MKQRLERRVRALSLGFFFALVFSLCGCSRHADRPVTVTILDPEWSQPELLPEVAGNNGDQRTSVPSRARQTGETERFVRETGIRVEHSPLPETSLAQLALVQKLLRAHSASPDLIGIDVIWPEIIDEYLLDLKPYFSSEISSLVPDLIASFTVKGKVVSIPYHMQIGVLAYRTDLLRKYGYTRPPGTWDELEKMAARIQAGERAEGKKDFWGYVWAGAIATDSEQLTMEGLEWQAAEGGGHIIESDGKISVNNPNVIRSWERAARWLGSISPPSVVSYTATDAENKFWVSGEAAFLLSHAIVYEIFAEDKPFRDLAGVTSVPAGKVARVATIGGYALGISRFSAHRAEAVKFIQFLIRKQAEYRMTHPEKLDRKVEYFEVPPVIKEIYPWWYKPGESGGSAIVSRPSAVAGSNYEAVSKAYTHALHSVLTRESTAPAAAAALENGLARIMGNDRAQPGTGSH